jgi:dihydropteroate synthase
MSRRPLDFQFRKETWHLGERTLLVGVLNVAPDSALDGGRYEDPDRAYLRAVELSEQGANIIELGLESFHPGSKRISEAEALRRLVPVLKRIRGNVATPLCVETYSSAIAEKALALGVEIIKDPTGITMDLDLPKVVARADAGFVIQHMRGTPETWAKLGSFKDPAGAVRTELIAAISRSMRAGIPQTSLIVDPGFGLGKRKEQNTDILLGFENLTGLHLPIMISTWGQAFSTEIPTEPSVATAVAAATYAVLHGAHFLRSNDLLSMRPAALMADSLLRLPEAREPREKPSGPRAPRPRQFGDGRDDPRPTRAPLRPRERK